MNIESRLASLERSNRQLKFLCAALCLALAGVFVIAADKPGDGVQDVIRAKEFQVIGPRGKVVARLHDVGDNGSLSLTSVLGTGAMAFTVTPDGGIFSIHGDKYAWINLISKDRAIEMNTGVPENTPGRGLIEIHKPRDKQDDAIIWKAP